MKRGSYLPGHPADKHFRRFRSPPCHSIAHRAMATPPLSLLPRHRLRPPDSPLTDWLELGNDLETNQSRSLARPAAAASVIDPGSLVAPSFRAIAQRRREPGEGGSLASHSPATAAVSSVVEFPLLVLGFLRLAWPLPLVSSSAAFRCLQPRPRSHPCACIFCRHQPLPLQQPAGGGKNTVKLSFPLAFSIICAYSTTTDPPGPSASLALHLAP
jgi:hypothetical protein